MHDYVVKFNKTNEDAKVPTYAHNTDCCCDLYSIEDVVIKPMERKLIDTGIAIDIPEGFEVQIRPRSGNAWKHGLTVLNTPGTIDEGYHNSIKVILINLGDKEYAISKGDRIAQMKLSPVYIMVFEEVEVLPSSARGLNGCGSTGN